MALTPLNIGDITTPTNLVLAPMSGVTNSCFRRLIKELNPGVVGLVVTEFISVEGLTRENERSLRMMKFLAEEQPISIQIFGHDIDRMVAAARMVEERGAQIVDINCGCPVPKVVRRGGGCELMRQPEHLSEMLYAVKQAVSIPLTIKIRAGWDERSRNCVEIAQIAEQAGVSLIAVHGRTKSEMYRGKADWDIIATVAQAVRVPVLGSGDVVDEQSAALALRSGAAGLMIGRGALANPWVFSEIAAQLSGTSVGHRSWQELIGVLRRYLMLLREEYIPKAVIGPFKQLASQMVRGEPGAAHVRRLLCRAQNLSEVEDILALAEFPPQGDVWCGELAEDRPVL